VAQEAKERAAALAEEHDRERRQQGITLRRMDLEAQIATLQAELAVAEKQLQEDARDDVNRNQHIRQDRTEMAKSRGA
jgi:hypothetical protein